MQGEDGSLKTEADIGVMSSNNQAMLGTVSNSQDPGDRQGARCPSEPSRGTNSANTLALAFSF